MVYLCVTNRRKPKILFQSRRKLFKTKLVMTIEEIEEEERKEAQIEAERKAIERELAQEYPLDIEMASVLMAVLQAINHAFERMKAEGKDVNEDVRMECYADYLYKVVRKLKKCPDFDKYKDLPEFKKAEKNANNYSKKGRLKIGLLCFGLCMLFLAVLGIIFSVG